MAGDIPSTHQGDIGRTLTSALTLGFGLTASGLTSSGLTRSGLSASSRAGASGHGSASAALVAFLRGAGDLDKYAGALVEQGFVEVESLADQEVTEAVNLNVAV